MDQFRDDLLGVFFVSNDGTFGFVVSRDEPGPNGLVIRAYRRPKGSDEPEAPLERGTAECIQTSVVTFCTPTHPTSTHPPSRLGMLLVRPDSDHDSAVFVMFGGPPAEGSNSPFAWVAVRPEVPPEAVAAFPYYRGSFMDSMNGEDWGQSYDSPSYWYSPQRTYRVAT